MMQRTVLYLLAVLLMVSLGSVRAADAPELSIELGETNQGMGLKVPSGGDGENVPETVGGSPARRIAGERALYMYVVLDHPGYNQGPKDLYVTVDVFDDKLGRLAIEYDKVDGGSSNPRYTRAEGMVFLTESRQWRKGVFKMPAARLGHGQNFGADFRLVGGGMAVRRITVSTKPPVGYDPNAPVDAVALAALAVKRPAGMEYTVGNDADRIEAAIYKALTVTSVESYVDWAGVEPREGEWDWSQWDKQVATLKGEKLKWVPFLIAGPAYATPLWFHNGPDSAHYVCLEHGETSKVQSIFNPKLKPYVERFLQAFAARYRDSGVLESLLLGVSGIYGESIYPAGRPDGGWTNRLTGPYHNHLGWWAGDPYAKTAFRAAVTKRYGTVAALNRAWGTKHTSFADVATFDPAKAPSDRARVDFVEWYQQSMTDWATFWVQATRKAFPKTPIYLCTGGDGNPMLGADFTAQTKAVAPFGAGVRITNEGSNYAVNFTVTREVATATRLYGTFSGFEPASQVDEKGIVARIYNATASGARQLHDYAPNTMTNGQALRNFRANASYLVPRKPVMKSAIYLPRESWAFDTDAIGRLYAIARGVRDLTDVDFVTRRSVADGVLKGHRLLLLAESAVIEPAAAATIEKWVRGGGILIATTRPSETLGSRLYDNTAWRVRLFSPAKQTGNLLSPRLEGAAPARWQLKIGVPGDDEWLFGQWFDRERGGEWASIPGATKRWSGAGPGVYLPVAPNTDYVLRLSAYLSPRGDAEGANVVRVNGQPVGRIDQAGAKEYSFPVPAAVIGKNPVARLQIDARTWRPSDVPGGTDTRHLGVGIRQVEIARADSVDAPVGTARLTVVVDPISLKPLTRRVGSGWTVFLPGLAAEPALLARTLAPLLRDTPVYLKGVTPLAPDDGVVDNVFTTRTTAGLLRYDATEAKIK